MNIVGYDCDGKPLKPGDKVVLLRAGNPEFKPYIGSAFTVKGCCEHNSITPIFLRHLFIETRESVGDGGEQTFLYQKDIKKIDDQERSNYTYDELIKIIKSSTHKESQEA